jgi:TPR repeat protein
MPAENAGLMNPRLFIAATVLTWSERTISSSPIMGATMQATAAIAFWLSLTSAALAGQLEDADFAFRAGDFVTAADLYRPIATQGEPVAQFRLGVLYEEGKGITKDSREAIRWYVVASQDSSEATFRLARLYHDGRGVPRNYGLARRWYRVAAQQDNAKAMVNLGAMNAHGEGGPRDYRKALKLFARAAQRGDDTAKNNIGLMYLKGLGVARDIVRALHWFTLAAAHGNAEAIRNRDKIAHLMTRKEFLRAEQMASKRHGHFR